MRIPKCDKCGSEMHKATVTAKNGETVCEGWMCPKCISQEMGTVLPDPAPDLFAPKSVTMKCTPEEFGHMSTERRLLEQQAAVCGGMFLSATTGEVIRQIVDQSCGKMKSRFMIIGFKDRRSGMLIPIEKFSCS